MEDSERRRERLKAMRTIAAQAEASSNFENPAVSGFLANPLLESPAALPAQEESRAIPRFDFYTDPMAAFSANKKRSAAGNQAQQGYVTPTSDSGSPMARFSSPRPGLRNTDMTPSPAHQIQMQSSYSPNQRMYQAHGPYDSPAPFWSPRTSPFPMHQENVAGYYSNPSDTYTRSPYPNHGGNPSFQAVGSPGFYYGQRGPPRHGNSPIIGSGRGGGSPYSGRTQGQWDGGRRNQVSSWSGRRGRGFHFRGTAPDEKLGPEPFYDKSMVEDPWQNLEPVVWRGLDSAVNNLHTPGSSNSVTMKKPRVSESSNKSSSQQSLAEYLAASFNEAVKDAASV
ncbi:hypothetical protein P3X46_021212 [Hevea brasiliensis]|uniref:Uncharacterized protein n=1 Tax=Hevea brasiliensis TaxID=3981 RepID=A0ABQ9LID5_HEVBR|nr:protein SICKLE [Hevea brasiliensis]KAJ9166461.1 hypothetical protein P3X46_021212 [Hevea brasiliensis]